ncbi:MAG: PKD domain-containing protein [Marinilabiliaceae bacterium]|nr:PKD domain-containing protein [Marinilabiliaceae bacterium]
MFPKIYLIAIKIVFFVFGSISFVGGQEINVSKLKINTNRTSEIAPLVHDSIFYFVSNRKSEVMKTFFNQDKNYLYRIYRAPLFSNGNIGKITQFRPDKSFKLSSGSIAFAPNDSYQIATFNKYTSYKESRSKSKKQENLLGLFESQKIGYDKWSKYTQLSFSEEINYSFAQPTISPDGQMLVYVSDMQGGYGETDLYYSTKTPYGWSDPINFGENVNSSAKEVFPFFHSSGILYFSSDRYGGQGGFDIYYTVNENGQWSKPLPLPGPINTYHDDFGCYFFPDGLSGYFVSTRDGTDNIYRFDYQIDFCRSAIDVVEENYCFTFFEERAIVADTIPVKYQWTFSDGRKEFGVEVDHCFSGPGYYEIELSVIDLVTDEHLYTVASYPFDIEKPQQVYFYLPEKTRAGTSFTMEAELTGFGDVENVRYFWSVNDSEPVTGKTFKYDFRRRGNYIIRCEAYWDNNRKICSQRSLIVE